MDINYKFVPEFVTAEEKHKKDVISYAGKLLEITQARTLVVTLDNNDVPMVWESPNRLNNAMDFAIDSY